MEYFNGIQIVIVNVLNGILLKLIILEKYIIQRFKRKEENKNNLFSKILVLFALDFFCTEKNHFMLNSLFY